MSAQIYFLYGEDQFSSRQKLKSRRDLYIKSFGDLNVNVVDAKALSWRKLEDLLFGAPFLGDHKLVILERFLEVATQDLHNYLFEKIDNLPEFLKLVIWESGKPDGRKKLFKKLKKQASVEEFEKLEGFELYAFVDEKFKFFGVQPKRAVTMKLVEYCGNNTGILFQEVQKICTFLNGAELSEQVVDLLVKPNLQSNIFKLTDSLGQGNARAAINILEILSESGEELMGVFFMLVRHFRILIQVKSLKMQGISAGQIAGELGLNPFVVNKMLPQINKFDFDQLKRIFSELAAIDSSIKLGKIRILTDDQSELLRAIELVLLKI